MTRHWRTRDDADGIRWLILDKADSGTNVLSQAVLWELADLVDEAAANPPAGVVLKSAKDSGFIAGADISEFRALADSGQAEELVNRGQALLNHLENLPCPTVAAIHGFALGGGMELALACDYRVAVESHERNLGLPEVRLGIHPGLGGTVRSVRLLGAPAALNLMLTGKSVSAVQARRMGLLDRIVPDGQLDRAARELVAKMPMKQRPPVHLRMLGLPFLRPLLGRRLRAQVRR
ncbi:MAG: enoyl-CoA hydratase-related protein, partial [Rhodospirillaceae bacterium]|nr:enoyl-CoA hydratase-related protein [Rhodospirillaceae bacterium]